MLSSVQLDEPLREHRLCTGRRARPGEGGGGHREGTQEQEEALSSVQLEYGTEGGKLVGKKSVGIFWRTK